MFGWIVFGGVGYERVERWVANHRGHLRIASASGLAMMGTFLISYWLIFLGQKFPIMQ